MCGFSYQRLPLSVFSAPAVCSGVIDELENLLFIFAEEPKETAEREKCRPIFGKRPKSAESGEMNGQYSSSHLHIWMKL